MSVAPLLAPQIAVSFLPQPFSPIDGLTMWAVVLCGDAPAPFSAGKVYQAAATRIVPIPRAQAQAMLDRQQKRSPWGYVPQALKLVGLAWTGLQAAEVVKISERRVQALAPAGTALLEAVDLLMRDRMPSVGLPADLLPPFVQIGKDACAEYSLFARPMLEEQQFTMEVK